VLGFPIRTPPDHSLVANSPGLIAGSNVLHRLLMPRHPPCALHSLSQQRQNNTHNTPKLEACASTKEHTTHPPIKEVSSNDDTTDANTSHAINNTFTTRQPTPPKKMRMDAPSCKDARVHYADLKQQPHQHPPPTPVTGHTQAADKGRTRRLSKADPSGPNSVLDPIPHQREATSNHHPHHDTQTSCAPRQERDRRRFH
jgi:hypothetical protein